MKYFAGLDWGGTEHAAAVIDQDGSIVETFAIPHTAEGLAGFLTSLARIAEPSEIPIAIERPNGLVVDTLVAAGHPVVPIHPNAMKASRPRYRAAGGKSDPEDAYILADLLRTDGHRFRALRPASDEIRALCALVRARAALDAQRKAVANQLRAVLESFWPGPVGLFCDLDSAISLAFIERYPTPNAALRLGQKRMEAFLARHRYSGGRSAGELLTHIKAAPTGLCSETEELARGAIVRAQIAVLKTLIKEVKRITVQVEGDVARLPLGQVVMSFPRAGKLNAAQILSELGDDPERFQTESQLAAEAGVAPVTKQSGKHRSVGFRYACNKRLRCAITNWANNSRHTSPWAMAIYRKAIDRGCHHTHAIRILARAWVRVLWTCLRTGQHYDPALHGGARALAEATA